MIKKLLVMLCIVCLVCSLVFALRGREEIFSSSLILDILQDSPEVPTSWVLSIDNVKIIDSNFRFPKYKLKFTGTGFMSGLALVQDGFYELQIPFVASLWNVTIDAVKSICYVGTMISQGIVYCSYFFAYLFA